MEYPSNSNKRNQKRENDEPTKKVERIIEGEIIRRQKSVGKRFKETFILGNAKNVFARIVLSILIPSARDALADASNSFFEHMIYGDAQHGSRRSGSRRGGSSLGHIDYEKRFTSSSSSSNSRYDEGRSVSNKARASHNFDEIILNTRAEAEEVVDRLFDLIEKFDVATVADLYDLLGVTPKYTDQNWGWTDLAGAGVSHVRGGYLLNLSKPEPLD